MLAICSLTWLNQLTNHKILTNGIFNTKHSLPDYIYCFCFCFNTVYFLFNHFAKYIKSNFSWKQENGSRQCLALFIPFFAVIWHFIIVSRISDSIKAESFSRNIELKETRPAYSIGLAMCIFNCTSIFSKVFGIFGIFTVIGFLVCWIIYWSKITSYKKQIIKSSEIIFDAESESPKN